MNPSAPFVLALSLSLAPCLAGSQAAMAVPAEQQVAAPAAEAGQRLNAMFERYFEEYLELNPLVRDPDRRQPLQRPSAELHRSRVSGADS